MAADVPDFVSTLAEWVDAVWFAEPTTADDRLRALLAFPPEMVLAGSVAVLARLLEAHFPGPVADVAAALADHLIFGPPDPGREALIADVLAAARSTASARQALLARHGPEAVERTALECASVLAQAEANRQGVIPSSILLPL